MRTLQQTHREDIGNGEPLFANFGYEAVEKSSVTGQVVPGLQVTDLQVPPTRFLSCNIISHLF